MQKIWQISKLDNIVENVSFIRNKIRQYLIQRTGKVTFEHRLVRGEEASCLGKTIPGRGNNKDPEMRTFLEYSKNQDISVTEKKWEVKAVGDEVRGIMGVQMSQRLQDHSKGFDFSSEEDDKSLAVLSKGVVIWFLFLKGSLWLQSWY